VGGVEAHGGGEFAGAVRQDRAVLFHSASFAHQVEAMDGFDGADEDGVGVSFGRDDHVERPIYAVEEEHIGASRWTEHGFRASRSSASCAVGGQVFGSSIRFAFDDSSGGRTFRRTMDEDGADEFGGDVEDFSIVKGPRQCWCVEGNAGQGQSGGRAWFSRGHDVCPERRGGLELTSSLPVASCATRTLFQFVQCLDLADVGGSRLRVLGAWRAKLAAAARNEERSACWKTS